MLEAVQCFPMGMGAVLSLIIVFVFQYMKGNTEEIPEINQTYYIIVHSFKMVAFHIHIFLMFIHYSTMDTWSSP